MNNTFKCKWPVTLGLPVMLMIWSMNSGAEEMSPSDATAPTLDYHRMYVDSEGVSHFGQGDLDFTVQPYAPPANPMAIHNLKNVQGATLVFIPSGAFEDWHPAPRRQFAFILQGTVEVTVGDGESRRFGPGQVVLLEDTTGKGHTTEVISEEDHISVMVPVAED